MADISGMLIGGVKLVGSVVAFETMTMSVRATGNVRMPGHG
jgi:hypothetical protein